MGRIYLQDYGRQSVYMVISISLRSPSLVRCGNCMSSGLDSSLKMNAVVSYELVILFKILRERPRDLIEP